MLFANALCVSAQDVGITISPAPGEYETLPKEFKLTFDGPSSIAYNMFVNPPVKVTSPSGITQAISGKYSGLTLTVSLPDTYKLDEKGTYTVELKAEAVNCTWSDGSKTKTELQQWTYEVEGKEEEPWTPTPVVYDIELSRTTPYLQPLNLADEDNLESLQLYFSMGNLQLASTTSEVTISGPNYSESSTLSLTMNSSSNTVYSAAFASNPKCNGTYTLTIPKGIVGDQEWIDDHNFGHTNDEINYEFTVKGGISSGTGTVSISPVPGEYDTLPNEFVLTITGPQSLKDNIAGGNPLLITSPKGTTQQVSGKISGTTITCTIPPNAVIKLDERGDYEVKFRGGSTYYVFEDGNASNPEEIFIYNVIGKEDETPEGPTDVQYDIIMSNTTPKLRPLDLEYYGIETLQLYFNMPNLEIDPNSDAIATISGPNFYTTVGLSPNYTLGNATNFKAMFPKDPVYDGTYTLTVPQGVLGDKEWIKDHRLGHANAEVNYEFTVVNGEDPSTITVDLTFNPRIVPSPGTKVSDLSKLLLTFDSTPYYKEGTSFNTYLQEDLREGGEKVGYGKATVTNVSGNTVTLTLNPAASTNGQYTMTLLEGVFWNEEHNADENAGKMNGEMPLMWYYVYAPAVKLEVTGHEPASDARISSFPANKECITIRTNVKNQVASAEFEVIEYKLDDDSAAPKTILKTTSTDLNANGYICWINRTGNDIDLQDGYYYEVDYILKNDNGNTLADGMFEFYGADGGGGNDDPVVNPVAYDLEISSTLPDLRPLDVENRTLETLKIAFNQPNLKIGSNADAKVTITGPNYDQTVALELNTNLATSTEFKAMFPIDPVYSGNYTLLIPKGILGDEAWIMDNATGHSNPLIRYEFTVINGKDESEITKDLTFNPNAVVPTPGDKVTELSKISMSFGSKPYWYTANTLDVYYTADLSESNNAEKFGTASIVKGFGSMITLTLDPTPAAPGEYSITLPEGIFWNEEHQNDENAGAVNAEAKLHWYLIAPAAETVEVTGHVPATDEYVSTFPANEECITIITDVKNKVASAKFELNEYQLDNISSAPVNLLDVNSTDVNSDGYICWINNTGKDIDLMKGYFYEVNYILSDASGNTLANGSFEFLGDSQKSGINEIRIDADAKIFNLQGFEVKGKTLPAGIYIVNGKKIVIR